MKEIRREIYPVLLEEFRRPEITIMVGARQARCFAKRAAG